ncbi:MAG: type II toxin-antitoxin system RelE/ParE family toxin [Acidobacteriota bacterium]
MIASIRFTAAAEQDLKSAVDYLEDQRRGLGEELRVEIRGTLRRLTEHPELYPVALESVRKAIIRRFPFSVFYRVEEKTIWILAVLHHARRPEILRQRLGP